MLGLRYIVLVSVVIVAGIAASTGSQSAASSSIHVSATPSSGPCPLKFDVVSNLGVVKAGDVVEFSIDSASPGIAGRTFEWTVNRGTIISGQGTSTIQVQTSEDMLRTPMPTPTPDTDSDVHGFIYIGGSFRPQLIATAKLIDPSGCDYPSKSTSVAIGRRSSKPVKPNLPADVVEVTLNTETIELSCPPERKGPMIDINTKAVDPEDDVITYEYTVTGGKIVGIGSHVQWDLADLLPGIYRITAGVDDGCGICGKTLSKEIRVTPCKTQNNLKENFK